MSNTAVDAASTPESPLTEPQHLLLTTAAHEMPVVEHSWFRFPPASSTPQSTAPSAPPTPPRTPLPAGRSLPHRRSKLLLHLLLHQLRLPHHLFHLAKIGKIHHRPPLANPAVALRITVPQVDHSANLCIEQRLRALHNRMVHRLRLRTAAPRRPRLFCTGSSLYSRQQY